MMTLLQHDILVQDTPNPLDERITEAEFALNEIELIISTSKQEYYHYKTHFSRKQARIQNLRNEIKILQGKNMMEDILESTSHWQQDTNEVFGDYNDDMNLDVDIHILNEIEDNKTYNNIIGDTKDELHEALGGLDYKKIVRKILFLLHEDYLRTHPIIKENLSLIDYLIEQGKEILAIHNNKKISELKKKTLILYIITKAGILYKDNNFELPDDINKIYENQKNNEKEKRLHQLLQQIGTLKSQPIYMFYQAQLQGYVAIRDKEMDNEIQRLEDLIHSFASM